MTVFSFTRNNCFAVLCALTLWSQNSLFVLFGIQYLLEFSEKIKCCMVSTIVYRKDPRNFWIKNPNVLGSVGFLCQSLCSEGVYL